MILDAFTDLKVSRQRKWQLRQEAKGLCQVCPEPEFMACKCKKHYRRWANAQAKRLGTKRRLKNTKFKRMLKEERKRK